MKIMKLRNMKFTKRNLKILDSFSIAVNRLGAELRFTAIID